MTMSQDLQTLWDEAATPPAVKQDDLGALWDDASKQTTTVSSTPAPESSFWEKAKQKAKTFFTPTDNYELGQQARDNINKMDDGITKTVAKAIFKAGDVLNEPYDAITKSDKERDQAHAQDKVSDILSQVNNTSDRSLYSNNGKQFLDAIGARDMTPQEKEKLEGLKLEDVKNVSKILKERDMGRIEQDDKGFFYVGKDGKQTDLGDLERTWSGIKSSKFESAGAIGGALKGASIPGPLPIKAIGGLIGGAIGAGVGRGADFVENSIRTDQDVNASKMTGQMVESAIADPVMTMMTAGAIKGTKALTAPVANRVKEFVIQRNINGAEKFLEKRGYTTEQIADIVMQADKYQTTPQKAWVEKGLEKRQDALADAVTRDPKIQKQVVKALKQYPEAAEGFVDTALDRSKDLIDTIEKKGMTTGQIVDTLDQYERVIKDNYDAMKNSITKGASTYRFGIQDTKIPQVLESLKKTVGDDIVEKKLGGILESLKENRELTPELLFNARHRINSVLRMSSVKDYHDQAALKTVKGALDDEIYKAIDSMPMEVADKTTLKEKMRESIADYAKYKEMQDTTLYKNLMHPDATEKSISDSITKSAKTFRNVLDSVSKKLDPTVRARLENRVIKDFVQSHAKDIGGAKVIDFESLGNDLSQITSDNIASKDAKETLTILKEMSDIFKNDAHFVHKAIDSYGYTPSQGVSNNPISRVKTMMANKVVFNVMTYVSDDAALRYHISKSLQKAKTPKEFLGEVTQLKGKVPDEFLQKMSSITAQWEKADARSAKEAEQDALLKQKRAQLEAKKDAMRIEQGIPIFQTPSAHEITAMGQLMHDDRYRSHAQMLARVADGSASEADKRKYLTLKNQLGQKVDETASILKSKADDQAAEIQTRKERNELDALATKAEKSEEELIRYNELDGKYNGQIMFTKGGDNLAAGMAAGVEEDQNGGYTLNPENFIMGLGGYTAAKALLKNPTVQREMKDEIGKQLEKYESSFMSPWNKFDAYHGTPHDVDKFSTQHIGTGEGNQAYGYGMYFSENKDTAKYYQKKLSNSDLLLDGKSTTNLMEKRDNPIFNHVDVYHNDGMDKAEILDQLKYMKSRNLKEGEKYFKDEQYQEVISAVEKAEIIQRETKGNLYQVDLKPKEHELLLWEKPLSKQSDYIKERLSQVGVQYGEKETGEDLYKRLKMKFGYLGGGDKKASELMNDLGIKGIKYPAGDNTYHNYVIFHDKNVGKPTKIGGVLVGAAGIGAAASDVRADETVNQYNNTIAYIGDNKEITMKNNNVLKDGKLTQDELVTLIQNAPDFEKHLATFGDVESEGREKVMNRLLSVFDGEDPVTALAMVAENFYKGDDGKFMKAINDAKIDNIDERWIRSMIESERTLNTPTSDLYFDRMNSNSFKYLDLDRIEGTTLTNDDGKGRTAWGGVDKIHSPKEFAALMRGDLTPSVANSKVMAREAKVTYEKLPWLKNAKQITQEIASILAMNVGGSGATKFAPTYKLIESGNIDEAIAHISATALTDNHKRHITRALQAYKKEHV